MLDALGDYRASGWTVSAHLRCAILTGAGDKAFCVGADINAWSALEPLDMWRSLDQARPSGVRSAGRACACR